MGKTVQQWKEKIEKSRLSWEARGQSSDGFPFIYANQQEAYSLESIKNLATALKENANISELDLLCVELKDEGIQVLANALENHPSITKVNFMQNGIGPKGAQALATLLVNNKRLKGFEVTQNYLGNEGAKIIANALSKSLHITDVRLESNNITDETAKLFIPIVQNNKKMESFKIEDTLPIQVPSNCKFAFNKVSPETIEAIGRAVKKNTELKVEALSKKRVAEVEAEFALRRKARLQQEAEDKLEEALYNGSNTQLKYGMSASVILVIGVVVLALGSMISTIIGALLLVGAAITIKQALQERAIQSESLPVGKPVPPIVLNESLTPNKRAAVNGAPGVDEALENKAKKPKLK